MVPGQGPAYYAALMDRIEAAQMAGDDDLVAKLTAFRRDCESLPHCVTRSLYVLLVWETEQLYLNLTALESQAVHPDYLTLRKRIHDDYEGAMFQGFWDYFFATREQNEKNPAEAWPVASLPNPFTLGIAQVRAYLELIPPDARVIIVGYSLGGTTALHLADAFRDLHAIEALILLDFVGMYGWRWNTVKSFWVPPNVHNFYNRWQTRGCFPGDFSVSAELAIENPKVTKARQEEAMLPPDVEVANAQQGMHSGVTRAVQQKRIVRCSISRFRFRRSS